MLIHTGTLALRLFTPPFGVLTADQQNLEGQFRFYHSRITTNAEEIAFYGGAQIEKGYLNAAYDELKRHSVRLYLAQLQFGTLESFIVKYFWGALVSSTLCLCVFSMVSHRPKGFYHLRASCLHSFWRTCWSISK